MINPIATEVIDDVWIPTAMGKNSATSMPTMMVTVT